MDDEIIENDETLYRGIKTFPNWWDFEESRPTSAAFKDSRGVSVDRDGDRLEDDVVSFFNERFTLRAIVSLSAQRCRDFNTHPVPRPEENNPYHAEIHNDANSIPLTSSKAKKLSRNCDMVFFQVD